MRTQTVNTDTQPLTMTKSMVESAWAEDMGQFLYHLDPNTGKIRLEKLQLKIINSILSSLIKLTWIYIYIYMICKWIVWGQFHF